EARRPAEAGPSHEGLPRRSNPQRSRSPRRGSSRGQRPGPEQGGPNVSVEMAAYLVDRDDFQEKVRHAEAYEVLEQTSPEPLKYDSAKAPSSFLEAFDSFKRAWKSDERLYFKEVFDTLFWSWRGHADQVMELDEGEDGDLSGIDVALKPETVKEL